MRSNWTTASLIVTALIGCGSGDEDALENANAMPAERAPGDAGVEPQDSGTPEEPDPNDVDAGPTMDSGLPPGEQTAGWSEDTCQIDDDGSSTKPGGLDVRSVVLAEDSGAGANDGITVYYPAIIESSDCTFKVIGWGNGSTGSGGAHYPKYFDHLASHGFVVAVPHTNLTVADSRPIRNAVEVVVQAGEDPSSPFFARVESDFGLMGKSLGAIAVAREMSEEDAVAAVLIGSGSSPETSLTKPALFATGDEDYLQRMVRGAYDASSGDAIYAQAVQTEGGFADGHFDLDDREGIVQLSTSFMRCHLRGNASACRYVSCRECQVEPWSVYETKSASE